MPQVIWAEQSITEADAHAAAQALTVIGEAGQNNLGAVPLLLQALGLKFVPEPEI